MTSNGRRRSVLLALAVASLTALTLFARVPGDQRWASDVTNFSHGPVFALITVAIGRLIRQPAARGAGLVREYLAVVAIAFLLGCCIELLQSGIGRDASISDLWRDSLGIVLAIGLLSLTDQRVRTVAGNLSIRTGGAVVAIAATAALLAPLVITAGAYSARHRQFPTLADFSAATSTYFLGAYGNVTIDRAQLPTGLGICCDGDVGLETRITKERWALAIWEPKPDWRGYRRIGFDLVNPTDAELVIQVRMRSKHGTRGSRAVGIGEIHISPRSRQVASLRLPAPSSERRLPGIDIGAIRGVALGHSPNNLADRFYLMKVWLE